MLFDGRNPQIMAMSLPAAGTQETLVGKPRKVFKGRTECAWFVLRLPSGQGIITCPEHGSLRLWNLENGLQIGKDWKDGKSPVLTIALSPDGKTVVSGSDDGSLRVWDVDTGKVIAKWTGHGNRVWSVCWSQDGQRVVSESRDGTTGVWDVESGETILRIKSGHTAVFAVVYSPDETMIATGGYDKLIKIWDARTGELVTTLKGHTGSVWCQWPGPRTERRLSPGQEMAPLGHGTPPPGSSLQCR
jgi:WD40 repeat protein